MSLITFNILYSAVCWMLFSIGESSLTWLVVSPECHSACANEFPGPVFESTSCEIKRDKATRKSSANWQNPSRMTYL